MSYIIPRGAISLQAAIEAVSDALYYSDLIEKAVAALSALPAVENEIADLKQTVIAFAAPWAIRYAKDWELPKGHLHPAHYDILAKCGARMDDFVRADLPLPAPPVEG